MNGIINKSLIALFFLGGTVVADGGGLEYGWTQLPDGRVEYIIQLDDKAIEALKNGQPLTSSLPPEVQNADRIRIQYGTGEVAKPVLLKKPQAFSPYPPANSTQGYSGSPQGAFRSTNVADTVPTLRQTDISKTPFNDAIPRGPVETQNGNQKTVSNSSFNTIRPATYITPTQGQGGRVLNNIDDFGGSRVVDSRGSNANLANDRSNATGTGTNFNLNPLNSNSSINPSNGTTNPATSGYAPGSASGTQGAFGNGNQNNGLAPVPPRNRNAIGNGMGGNGQVGNGTGQNWQSVGGQGQQVQGTGYQPPTTGTGGNYTGFPNAGQNQVNPNVNNPTVNGTNYQQPNPAFQQPNPNYQQPPAGYNPALQAVQGPYQYPQYVTAQAPPNQALESSKKELEDYKNEQKEKERLAQIEKIREEARKDKEENLKLILELQKQLDEKSKDESKRNTEDRVTPVNSGVTPVSDDDNSRKSGNSTAITIFLLFSIGLNVFLVIQYLSVQNQFRDLSNDLRDSFMANNYE